MKVELESVLAEIGLTPAEAAPLLWEARIAQDITQLDQVAANRLQEVISRRATQLAGRDWRRADGADGAGLGKYDLFHKRSGQHQRLETFGDLLRWSEQEYGWRTNP